MAEDMFKVLWRCRRDKFLRDITDRNTLGKAPLEKTEETFGELIKRRGSMNYMDTLWWLERLKDQGIKPGLATYRVVLERLSHADNLNRKAAYKAVEILTEMKTAAGIEPDNECFFQVIRCFCVLGHPLETLEITQTLRQLGMRVCAR